MFKLSSGPLAWSFKKVVVVAVVVISNSINCAVKTVDRGHAIVVVVRIVAGIGDVVTGCCFDAVVCFVDSGVVWLFEIVVAWVVDCHFVDCHFGSFVA